VKIFIGPIEIAGYYGRLAIGLRDLGYEVNFYLNDNTNYNYEILPNLKFGAILNYLKKQYEHSETSNPFHPYLVKSIYRSFYFLWGLRVIFTHKVFIFGFGRSLFNNGLDLRICKILGKIVICNISHGSEARPPYFNGIYNGDYLSDEYLSTIHMLTKEMKKRLTVIEKYADFIIGSPKSSSPFINRNMIHYLNIGHPLNFHLLENFKKNSAFKPFKILHAPTRPVAKGAQKIEEVVNRLIRNGYNIEFVKLTNVSNYEVLNELSKCNLVIDQLYSDIHLPIISAEAGAIGIPSIVCGYEIRDHAILDSSKIPPGLICLPEELEISITTLLNTPSKMENLSNEINIFLKNNWNITSVAKNFERLILKDVPNNWYFDPSETDYIYGACIEQNQLIMNLQLYIEKYGFESLNLKGHQALISKLRETLSYYC
jgi:hypothetical protein